MSKTNKNKVITCVDCGNDFELTEGWHKLIAENSEIQLPKRCYDCRQKRKKEKEKETPNPY